jgi:ribosomal protein S19E (S16A)
MTDVQEKMRDWQYARIAQIRKLKKTVSIKELTRRFGASLVDRALNTKPLKIY